MASNICKTNTLKFFNHDILLITMLFVEEPLIQQNYKLKSASSKKTVRPKSNICRKIPETWSVMVYAEFINVPDMRTCVKVFF